MISHAERETETETERKKEREKHNHSDLGSEWNTPLPANETHGDSPTNPEAGAGWWIE